MAGRKPREFNFIGVATSHGIRYFLCFVRATLTWFVQPLDASVIRKLNAFGQAHYRRLHTETTRVNSTLWTVLRLLMASVRKVLQGNAWASSIDECGYFAHAKGAGSQVRALFGRADCAALTTQTERPTAIRITEMLPKKQVYAVNARWWTCVQMFTALSLPLFTR